MKPILPILFFFVNGFLNFSFLHAQQDSSACKVNLKELVGIYTGDCQKGLANGKGDAKGAHHYTGSFKNGLPDGTGVYYYNDSVYYSGDFQDGVKEGKGEAHYLRKSMPDSIIKGYWSGGEYRGKRYITYNFSTTEQFDQTQITPSGASGNTVSIEIGTTSGSPNGSSLNGIVLELRDLISPTSSILKVTSKYVSAFKSYANYEIISFPCKLFGTLSDGRTFEVELYKAANWKIRLYKNI
jgi:hypothetical protein